MKHLALCALIVLIGTACSSDDDGTNGSGAGVGKGGGGGGGGDGGSGAAPSGPQGSGELPPAQFIPEATGACPGFAEGAGCTRDDVSLICTFTPAGIPPRPARVWLGPGAFDGLAPVVFFFHGLTRNAGDAVLPLAGLGPDIVDGIVAAGGLVVSMEKDTSLEPNAFPWISGVSPAGDDDFLVMDEILGCAIDEVGIDLSHIHVTGMSAGGLQTGATVARRSGYVASATTFSGGQPASHEDQHPENRLPVLIVHGGPNDIVVLNFEDQALQLQSKLDAEGHFNILCNHGRGHVVDEAAAAAAWRFFQDHPYNEPSPYATGLPAGFPEYCAL
jgi:poly(3-hydroxybutyrate) depolymerase